MHTDSKVKDSWRTGGQTKNRCPRTGSKATKTHCGQRQVPRPRTGRGEATRADGGKFKDRWSPGEGQVELRPRTDGGKAKDM